MRKCEEGVAVGKKIAQMSPPYTGVYTPVLKGWTPTSLQNEPGYPGNPEPTVRVSVDDVEWNECYARWKSGKTPSDNPEWKRGVYLTHKMIVQHGTPFNCKFVGFSLTFVKHSN